MDDEIYEEVRLVGKIDPASAIHFRDELIRTIDFGTNPKKFTFQPSREDLKSSRIVIWHRPIWEAATRGHECFEQVPQVAIGVLNDWTAFFLDDSDWCGDHDKGRWSPMAFVRAEPLTNRLFLVLPIHENMKITWFCTAFSDIGFQQAKQINKPESRLLQSYMTRLCAEIAFLQQPFVNAVPHVFSRPDRRRAAKANRPLPDVRIVRLRKSESKCIASDGSAREYSCHWLVGAHWRRPNERMKEQRPVYVRPYVKGPSDKPFKSPTSTVYVAVR